jgi:hypothetical protein
MKLMPYERWFTVRETTAHSRVDEFVVGKRRVTGPGGETTEVVQIDADYGDGGPWVSAKLQTDGKTLYLDMNQHGLAVPLAVLESAIALLFPMYGHDVARLHMAELAETAGVEVVVDNPAIAPEVFRPGALRPHENLVGMKFTAEDEA